MYRMRASSVCVCREGSGKLQATDQREMMAEREKCFMSLKSDSIDD